MEKGEFMIEEIAGIELIGGSFFDNSKLDFFKINNNSYRASLVYGRNGSGKSTIAAAFNNINNAEIDQTIECRLLNFEKNPIEIDNSNEKICVFDENFVQNNVKLSKDGLETIVLIGDEVKYQKELEEYTGDKKRYEKNKTKLDEEIEKYKNSKNIESHQYWENMIFKKLRESNGWADRERQIKNNRQNSSVNKNIIKRLTNKAPQLNEKQLIEEFKEKLNNYKKISDYEAKQVETPSLEYNFIENCKYIKKLICVNVKKPSLTERQKKIINQNNSKIKEIKEYFLKEDICPYCLQDVDIAYKEFLFNTIDQILDDEVEKITEDLEKSKLNNIDIDLDKYFKIDSELTRLCKIHLKKVNSNIDDINSLINKKLKNLYQDIDIPKNSYINDFIEFKRLMKNLIDACENYNQNLKISDSLKSDLIEINNSIAYYEIISYYENYLDQKDKLDNKNKEVKEINLKILELNNKINELEAKKSNEELAMKQINSGLSYIFFSNDRLRLEYRDKKYYLKSNGASVLPHQISTGERNAIALCYFFSKVIEGKDRDKSYSSNYLLVLDDPVSSFDFDNRIGILSYLKFQLNKFVSNKNSSKFLVMTHDLQTLFDLDKIFEEICEKEYKTFKLEDKKIDPINLDKYKQYSRMLELIFDYANSKKTDNTEIAIGNTMRKVLEAFSTFNYRVGIETLSTDKNIMKNVDSELKPFFENLLYRLVLHNESHTQEKIISGKNLEFFEYVSPKEKKMTAKGVICLLYCLNKYHVINYLISRDNVEEKIENWLIEIKTLKVS